MWLWLAIAPPALADGCSYVGKADITGIAAPAVVVLGERKGMLPDLSRASAVVRGLAQSGPVTLALADVPATQQPVLDDFAAGKVDAGDLPGLLAWDTAVRYPWAPYEPLVTAAIEGTRVVAVGAPFAPTPADAVFSVPPGYARLLEDGMAGHPVPRDLEQHFAQTWAWQELQLAQRALQAWDGQGYLVIVVDRAHVEGGLGVQWQAERAGNAPVSAFLLRDAESACYTGDQIWR